jgi:hypothetical protein
LPELYEGWAVFLMRLLLAKKAENLLAKSENEAMELGSRVENQSLAALVSVYGKALHITGSSATCRVMTSVYTLR